MKRCFGSQNTKIVLLYVYYFGSRQRCLIGTTSGCFLWFFDEMGKFLWVLNAHNFTLCSLALDNLNARCGHPEPLCQLFDKQLIGLAFYWRCSEPYLDKGTVNSHQRIAAGARLDCDGEDQVTVRPAVGKLCMIIVIRVDQPPNPVPNRQWVAPAEWI